MKKIFVPLCLLVVLFVAILNSSCGEIDAKPCFVENPQCSSNDFTKYIKIKSVWADEITGKTIIEVVSITDFKITTTFHNTDYICDSNDDYQKYYLQSVSADKKFQMESPYQFTWTKDQCIKFVFDLIPSDIESINFMLSYIKIKDIEIN